MAATYHQHAALGRWITEHAPMDLTDQLAELCDRASRLPDGEDGLPAPEAEESLLERHRQRSLWLADHHGEISTWSEIQRYEYRLGQIASFTQPDHISALLGRLPDRIDQVRQWQSSAGAIEAYRWRWNLRVELGQ
jgi:hypothetical protein